MNIRSDVERQWRNANSTITGILLDAPNEQDKGTIDARCQWPIAVFESATITMEGWTVQIVVLGGLEINATNLIK